MTISLLLLTSFSSCTKSSDIKSPCSTTLSSSLSSYETSAFSEPPSSSESVATDYILSADNPVFTVLNAPTIHYPYTEANLVREEETLTYPQFTFITSKEVTAAINSDIQAFIASLDSLLVEEHFFYWDYQISMENEEIVSLFFTYTTYSPKGAYPPSQLVTKNYSTESGAAYILPESVYEETEGFLSALLVEENLVDTDGEQKDGGLDYLKDPRIKPHKDWAETLEKLSDPNDRSIQFYIDKTGAVCFVFGTIHVVGDFVVLSMDLRNAIA